MIGQILGGVGLFLLGMILMTDGLKSAAGNAMRTVLARFTGGPIRGMISGAALTALVQSSSATTLATIGFVSAGLLSFPAALGVIFGINIGTTSTGWIVSLLGLKFKIAALAMPLVGIGALLRLLTKGKPAAYGTALAGFGLIFVGIDVLQTGMSDLSTRIDPSRFPQGPLFGRILLILVGIVMTVVMQSSSAAVATTLTALHSEAITVPQAAALVIGQNVGTTVKALLASIGGSIAVKRTAAAHIIFNIVTAVAAFMLLPLFLAGLPLAFDLSNPDSSTAAIALFHTGFNVLGVVIFLPFLTPFANHIVRLVPEHDESMSATRFFDRSVADTGAVGIEVARRALLRIGADIVNKLDEAATGSAYMPPSSDEHRTGLAKTREFLARVSSSPEQGKGVYHAQLSLLHALDHLDRLTDAVDESRHAAMLKESPELRERVALVSRTLREGIGPLDTIDESEIHTPELAQLSRDTAQWRRDRRVILLEESARGERDPQITLAMLEAIRWIDRLAYHAWRAFHHLSTAGKPSSASEPPHDGHEGDEYAPSI